MTIDQPRSSEEPDFVGSIQLRRPAEDAASEVVRHFEWRHEDVQASGDVGRGDAGLMITRIEVSAPLPQGVTRQLLRRVPLAEVLKVARVDLAGQDMQVQADTQLRVPSGRTAVTDDLLRNVSLAYLEETAPGKDRQATRRLAERFGRPEGTVRTWVARARKEGWLGPGASGRMGAEPGPKLRAATREALREVPRVQKELSRIATALGAKTAHPTINAMHDAADPAERALIERMGFTVTEEQLPALIASWVLFDHSVSTELGFRVERMPQQDALDAIGRELREAVGRIPPPPADSGEGDGYEPGPLPGEPGFEPLRISSSPASERPD